MEPLNKLQENFDAALKAWQESDTLHEVQAFNAFLAASDAL